MEKTKNLYLEIEEAVKNPRILSSLSPLNQAILKEIFKKDLGKKRGAI